jgi:hypothetical protein
MRIYYSSGTTVSEYFFGSYVSINQYRHNMVSFDKYVHIVSTITSDLKRESMSPHVYDIVTSLIDHFADKYRYYNSSANAMHSALLAMSMTHANLFSGLSIGDLLGVVSSLVHPEDPPHIWAKCTMMGDIVVDGDGNSTVIDGSTNYVKAFRTAIAYMQIVRKTFNAFDDASFDREMSTILHVFEALALDLGNTGVDVDCTQIMLAFHEICGRVSMYLTNSAVPPTVPRCVPAVHSNASPVFRFA